MFLTVLAEKCCNNSTLSRN